jgi:hypothetical protein
MLPEQVANGWDTLAPMIVQSLPPTVANNPIMLANVITAIMLEEADVWILTDGGHDHSAVALTTYMFDPVARIKMMVLYSVYGITPLDDEKWNDGFTSLRKFAKARGCKSIIAYTQFDRVKQMAEKNGADISYTLLTMGVDI